MKKASEEKLLEQEVQELTALLRTNTALKGLRNQLEERGLNPNKCIMGGFYEDEHDNQFGMIITDKKELYYFDINWRTEKLKKWERRESADSFTEDFAAARIAVSLAEKGDLV